MPQRRRNGLSLSKRRQTASIIRSTHITQLKPEGQATEMLECCHCSPISSLHSLSQEDHGNLVPTTTTLNHRLRTLLDELIPHTTPLSIFLFHVSQVEQAQMISKDMVVPPRSHYHVEQGLLEQVLASVRRAIRADDRMLLQDNSGGVLILPHVDSPAVCNILERISRSLALLQAETMIPPLSRETTILIGYGTYPEARISVEQPLYYASLVARRFTLRPAITTHLWDIVPTAGQESNLPKELPGIPFLDLPEELSACLKRLIPYQLAEELRCVPVGHDQHYLTVAMADPGNAEDVRRLQEVTGMTVFPVSCKKENLDALLLDAW